MSSHHHEDHDLDDPGENWLGRLLGVFLRNRLVILLLTLLMVAWGIWVAPFDWKVGDPDRQRVAVDAIPDIGDNQQIVFTEWMGRSPQDVEDQITYPLTAALLGLPEVKTIRSHSFFGFSSIYIIFNDNAEFYWSRSRILEKLNSLPQGTLPEGVAPALGPDATALGQVFWYTLEGRDADGKPASGWSPQELRSIQDYYVRYALQGIDGVAEVASIGGFVKEYQIDVDPDAMRAYGVSLDQVFQAVRQSNSEVGARTIEINRVEYVVRGKGFIANLDDLRQTVVTVRDNVPIMLEQIATLQLGPALRRGALDKDGAEAVGGVVVARFGANPMQTIDKVKEEIAALADSLPKKTLEDGRTSQVTVVPFYDRSGLIEETLDTLSSALSEEILVTIIVVLMLVFNLRASLLISIMLPLAVLFAFIGMYLFDIDANIVALSGIAIAIGTIVDMGIVVTENVLKRIESHGGEGPDAEPLSESVRRGTAEVGSAVMTAVLTTVIGFLPVFFMIGPEGKLFRPLAFTKTFALLASVIIAIVILPPLATLLLRNRRGKPEPGARKHDTRVLFGVLTGLTAVLLPAFKWTPLGGDLSLSNSLYATAIIVVIALVIWAFMTLVPKWLRLIVATTAVAVLLAFKWAPLGPDSTIGNLVFVVIVVGGLLLATWGFIAVYPRLLRFFLGAKWVLVALVASLLGFGCWVQFNLGREFMPALDEGSFLWMPTVMPHASIGASLEVMQLQDRAIRAIPEVDSVVGKIGRVESSLDPAPISMIETVIAYKPEYGIGENGERVRLWRDHIKSPDDIWNEISAAAQVPGSTSAPKLQPIQTRLVMLQTGMRAPMGLKVRAPDLESLAAAALKLETVLKEVPSIRAETVFADRVVGKPYLEINIDREAIARYGISVRAVQDVIEVAVGGRRITTTVEGRERYPVRVRYQRERRDSIEELNTILVPTAGGAQVPLAQLASIDYHRGPQAIKSEDTFLVGYVIFDKQPGFAEVEVVEEARAALEHRREAGTLELGDGVEYRFTGAYENQARAAKTLSRIIPIVLLLIFILIYLQFRSVATTLFVFSGVLVAWAGGFAMIFFYNQPWFLDLSLGVVNLRELFQIHPLNLSIAVWVGFLALFGIATDDGVLMATYLKQRFAEVRPDSHASIRETTIEAAIKRNRPAMMTTATTLLALLPVLTSTGRGADVMAPMAIPTFGGMVFAILTVFVVPVLYCWAEERKLSATTKDFRNNSASPEPKPN